MSSTTPTVKKAATEGAIGKGKAVQVSHAQAQFTKNALQDAETGELYLGLDQFINAIAPEDEDFHKIKREQYTILFPVADRGRRGRVTQGDWTYFENLLAKPDAEYEVAFRLFDVEGLGKVRFDDFRQLYERNKSADTIPFNWDCEWARLYLGDKRKRHDLDYTQFSQMLRGLQGERIRQAFQQLDRDADGFIEPDEFERIIRETARHKLSDHLLGHLHTLCNISQGSKVSYANVRAFQNIVTEMDLVELIVRHACHKSHDGRITRTDFLNQAARTARFTLFTPMEADILFHFASIDEPSGRLGWTDFAKVLDPSWRSQDAHLSAAEPSALSAFAAKHHMVDIDPKATALHFMADFLESIYNFGLGSIAGAFGAFMVYPIDLVKTRMQNQRDARPGERLYKNSIDCFQKVVRNEGALGLYSGVLPQLVGVAPEKAIKLTVNDLVRGWFSRPDGSIWVGHEILAGGSAGACQVVFTNPLEIVKIRLQVQGEVAKNVAGTPKRSAMWIIRNLGLMGLYKGASACLLRDVPFSAIYFPTYSHLKKDMFGETATKKLSVWQLLTAGAIAGMPAAYLTTPCDVIKTRLQVEARHGDTQYHGLRHAAATIWKEEGFKAFFKGGPARIMRSSPQFGFTLAAYEVLQGIIPYPGDSTKNRKKKELGLSGAGDAHDAEDAGVIAHTHHDRASSPFVRSRNALRIILDLDEGFGKLRLPDEKGWQSLPRALGGKA